MKQSIFAVSLISLVLNANESSIITSLNDDIRETTQLATQTNHNIDYQPFILSILHNDEISSFGIKTLGEALMLIPGVDMATNTMNNRTPIFRGSNPTAYGQSTLVIDGVVVNDDLFSNYNSYLDLPIELIDRIEVVRGAGSFIEGVNGYAGTINVITKAQYSSLNSENGTLFGWGGNNGMMGLGGWSRYHGKTWKLSLDAFTQRHDKETPISVIDAAGRSGSAQLGMKQNGFGIAYENKGFSLHSRYNDYRSDSAFGNLNLLPNEDGKLQQPSWYIQGKYTLPLMRDMNLILKTSIMENTWKSDSTPLPANFVYNSILLPDGYSASLLIKSRRLSGAASLDYTGLESHHLTAGIESTWNEAVDMHSITTNKVTGIGMVDYSNTAQAFIDAKNAKRQTTNLFLSDMITINDMTAIALTAGQIQTSDIKSHTHGRAAIVYQPSRSDIFKLMAASGVRYPSFQEMYITPSPYGTGNPNLTHEHVRSIEAQYLRKLDSTLTAELNFFYISNSQQIVRDQAGKFQNYGKSTIYGTEAELHGKFSSEDTVSFSYSYLHGKTEDNQHYEADLPYTASHLIKTAYAYDLSDKWTLGGVWQYVGSKKRYSPDTRDNLAAYNTLDIALGWGLNQTNEWYFQGVIDNIGNTVVRYPSPSNTYANDYPIEGRTFWIRTGYKF